MPDWAALRSALRDSGLAIDEAAQPQPVSGGAWRLAAACGPVFLKTAAGREFARLDGEADGLEALAKTGVLRVPRVLACGVAGNDAYLALEWLDFEQPSAEAQRSLGRGLAALHRTTGERFGWHRDNTIGAAPQVNTPSDDWIAFYRERRLRFQLELAASNGYRGALQAEGNALLAGIERLFDGYAPVPSLLHGDLWGGNWSVVDGQPVIFDPAVHYGDRECDLAMTRLFGGFGREFYSAYEQAWPLAPGHERRLPLYQLYHVLNHLNLFGSGYLGRALALIRRTVL